MISQEYLKSILDYNPNTGIFTWKVNKSFSGKSRAGKQTGYKDKNGYMYIRIDYKLYRSHRLAWLYMYGEFTGEIDHIDNNPSNNAINNLRLCTSSQNKCNMRLRSDSTSKVKGLHWYKAYKKWQVNITINKKTKCLGYFEDFFEACCTIYSARNKLHGEFANHGNY